MANIHMIRPTTRDLLEAAPNVPDLYRPVLLAIASGTPFLRGGPNPDRFVMPAFGGRAWLMVLSDPDGTGPTAWHAKSLAKLFRKAMEVHLATIEPPVPLAYEMAAHGASEEKRNALVIETTEEATAMWTDYVRRVAPGLVRKFITEGGRA